MTRLKFAVVDRCPVPAKAAPFVIEAKRRSGQTLSSCFRGREARAILARFGKHDQAFLYDGFRRGLPGFNPANPPGFSTHECFNDGPAFPRLRRGARIPDELVGQDWSNGAAVAATYRAMGVNAALTYPGSAREAQHVNIRVIPKKLKPPLKRGDGRKGGGGVRKRVNKMTGRLSYVARPNTGGKRSYLGGRRNVFDKQTEVALKDFQEDHGLKPDGVYGEMTEHQLDIAYDHWHKRRTAGSHHGGTPTPARPPSRPTPPKQPPKAQKLQGVDVSDFQGDIAWKKVKAAGTEFAIVKATEGVTFTDPRCTAGRVDAIRDAGLVLGFYHFARPQPGRTPAQEASHFVHTVERVGGLDGTCLLALDIEWVQGLGQKQLRAWARGFCRFVKTQTGITPIIYTGAWFWNPRTGNPASYFGRHPLWLAAYVKDPRPFVPKAWRKKGWTIWQHSDKGRVDGIPHPVDVNVFNGSLKDLKRLGAS